MSVSLTVTKSVSGLNESKLVEPVGGLLTVEIGGLIPSGIGPIVALLKFPGVTTPGVPYDSTMRYCPLGTLVKV